MISKSGRKKLFPCLYPNFIGACPIWTKLTILLPLLKFHWCMSHMDKVNFHPYMHLSISQKNFENTVTRGGTIGRARGAKAPLKVSKKGKMKKYDVFSGIKARGGGFFHQNRTWMCLPDLENLTISIPIFCQISHPSVYHFQKKSTQFGSNWVLFTIICPKFTQFM